MIKVRVNGFGTIGKRVAEAIQKQEDMKLYGISDVSKGPEMETLLSPKGELHKVDVYASNKEGAEKLRKDNVDIEGTLEEHSDEIDIVVDSTPSGVDKSNKENIYKPNNLKAVFQGGAPDDIADVKFNADANYQEANGENYVKVVSCNTTSLSRTMNTLKENFGVDEVVANLVRRGGDIPQDGRGPINSIIPVTDVPSHHGPDVKAVMPELDIKTLAVKVPVTYGHVHMVNAELEQDVNEEEIIEAFDKNPRINLLEAEKGFDSTSKVHEMMRDLGRKRSDMQETGVWKETITVEDGTCYWIHMVHQESIVTPDTIDAIRSMLGVEGKQRSMEKTNNALGIN
jgi:glyceraldehyde-3-phosphate dehydrogenase (NAD(P))